MRHVVLFSAGVGSFAAAANLIRRTGRNIDLVFADTLTEDADSYRFLIDGAAYVLGRAGIGEVSGLLVRAGTTPPITSMHERRAHLDRLRLDTKHIIPGLVWLVDGRTTWDAPRDEQHMEPFALAPCAQTLKWNVCEDWLASHCDPETTTVYVGISSEDEPRLSRLRDQKGPWKYCAPLCEAPADIVEVLRRAGIRPPRILELELGTKNIEVRA
jgi:hypothetical protein